MSEHKLTDRKIGFIGLGQMGRPMARHLHAAGASMVVANRSQGPVEELAGEGMTAAANGAALTRQVDTIVMCLTDTPALDAVLHGPDGVIAGLEPGKLVVDMGSSKVAETRAWATEIIDRECDYVDAPVSGGVVGAQAASLSIMAGGSDQAMARARPLFEVLGRNITHVGNVGTGQIAKITNQAIVALGIAAVAEALTLAARAGADPKTVRQALLGGFADSRILDLHGGRMLDADEDFTSGGAATVQQKDVDQALELAAQSDFEMPSLSANKELWDRMIAMGFGDFDHAGLIKIYEEDEDS